MCYIDRARAFARSRARRVISRSTVRAVLRGASDGQYGPRSVTLTKLAPYPDHPARALLVAVMLDLPRLSMSLLPRNEPRTKGPMDRSTGSECFKNRKCELARHVFDDAGKEAERKS